MARRKGKETPRLDLIDPRPMSAKERALYGLLVDDLADAVGGRLRAGKRLDKVQSELAALIQREGRVREQLRMFEPELEGMRAA